MWLRVKFPDVTHEQIAIWLQRKGFRLIKDDWKKRGHNNIDDRCLQNFDKIDASWLGVDPSDYDDYKQDDLMDVIQRERSKEICKMILHVTDIDYVHEDDRDDLVYNAYLDIMSIPTTEFVGTYSYIQATKPIVITKAELNKLRKSMKGKEK